MSLPCSIWWPRAPAPAALALCSGDLVLSPCAGCVGGRMAILQRLVLAMYGGDAGVEGTNPCALGEMGTDQCRILGGVVVARSAVAAKMER